MTWKTTGKDKQRICMDSSHLSGQLTCHKYLYFLISKEIPDRIQATSSTLAWSYRSTSSPTASVVVLKCGSGKALGILHSLWLQISCNFRSAILHGVGGLVLTFAERWLDSSFLCREKVESIRVRFFAAVNGSYSCDLSFAKRNSEYACVTAKKVASREKFASGKPPSGISLIGGYRLYCSFSFKNS